MKTQEILTKYRALLAPILGITNLEDINILVGGKSIGEYFDVDKKEIATNHFRLGDFSVTYRTKKTKKVYENVLSTFKLYQMPHCCGIMVSCNAFVISNWRHKGIGLMMNNLRQEIGRGLGYSVMFCTDVSQNEYQRKLLATQGFQDIYNFVNKRTNNRVYMSIVNL